MVRVLNVAEKNDAARSISSILSHGQSHRREGQSRFNKIYEFRCDIANHRNANMVFTSVSGHLLNIEFYGQYKVWTAVPPEALFSAPIRYFCSENMAPVKRTLERECLKCQLLIIWTDCDREGEAIGFEIIDVCRAVKPNLEIKRARFSDFTAGSIHRALRNLVIPDQQVADAVACRQELDLKIGAAFTRFQTLRLQRKFPQHLAQQVVSYGSCQFPTLGFVVERYKAQQAFIPEAFWKIIVKHSKHDSGGICKVDFSWNRVRLFYEMPCTILLERCRERPTATVQGVTQREKRKFRPIALDTVELEKLGSRKLHISAHEVMGIAERLYNKGIISYPRTETNKFPPGLDLQALVQIQTPSAEWGGFAQRILNEGGPWPRNGHKTDEAHPPIHPTTLATNLQGNDSRVYELIVRHFLACLHKDALGSQTRVTIDVNDEGFHAEGLMILELNYLEVYPYDRWTDKAVPHYVVGEQFQPDSIEMTDGVTTAPPLLTEADLISLMEKHGIGTDATHAEHIEKIKARYYVQLLDNRFLPANLGMGLVEGYDNMGYAISKPFWRAGLENDLKLICEGRRQKDEVLAEQLRVYKEIFQAANNHPDRLDAAIGQYFGAPPPSPPRPGGPGHMGGGGGGSLPRRNDDDDDDDDDNDNPPAGGGVNNARGGGVQMDIGEEPQDRDREFNPDVFKRIFSCAKCCGDMMVKQKRDGNSFYIGCLGYPDCKFALWLPRDAISHVDVLDRPCPKCPTHRRSYLVRFTFHQSALAYPVPKIYTGCLLCDPDLGMWLGLADALADYKIDVSPPAVNCSTLTRSGAPPLSSSSFALPPASANKTVHSKISGIAPISHPQKLQAPKFISSKRECLDSRNKPKNGAKSSANPGPSAASSIVTLGAPAGYASAKQSAAVDPFRSRRERPELVGPTSAQNYDDDLGGSSSVAIIGRGDGGLDDDDIIDCLEEWDSLEPESNKPKRLRPSAPVADPLLIRGKSESRCKNSRISFPLSTSANPRPSTSSWKDRDVPTMQQDLLGFTQRRTSLDASNDRQGVGWREPQPSTSASSFVDHSTANFDDGAFNIVCNCGANAKLLTVRKQNENHGRQFYLCGMAQKGCEFFLWADQKPETSAGGGGDRNTSDDNSFAPAISEVNFSSQQNYNSSLTDSIRNSSSRSVGGTLSTRYANIVDVDEECDNDDGDARRVDASGLPDCDCRRASVLRTVNKDSSANKGKQFFACARFSCKFFQWLDDGNEGCASSGTWDGDGGGCSRGDVHTGRGTSWRTNSHIANFGRTTEQQDPCGSGGYDNSGARAGFSLHGQSHNSRGGRGRGRGGFSDAVHSSTACDENVPMCRCGEPSVLRTVRKQNENEGRQFYCCVKMPEQGKCNFFEWSTDGDDRGAAEFVSGKGNRGRGMNSHQDGHGPRMKQRSLHASGFCKKRKCGICREEGHNSRNCPNK